MNTRTKSAKKKAAKTSTNQVSAEQSLFTYLDPATTPSNSGNMPEEGHISMQECEQHTTKMYDARPAAVVLQIIPENLKRIYDNQSMIAQTLVRISERLDVLEKACIDGQKVMVEQVQLVKDTVERIDADQSIDESMDSITTS